MQQILARPIQMLSPCKRFLPIPSKTRQADDRHERCRAELSVLRQSRRAAPSIAPRRLSRRVVYRTATIFAATNCTECVDPASAPRAEKTSSRITDKVVECHAHRLHNLALCLAIFPIASYLCLLPPATSLTLSTSSSSRCIKIKKIANG